MSTSRKSADFSDRRLRKRPVDELRRRPVNVRARPAEGEGSLDPSDWSSLRAQGHRMLDDILDYMQHIRECPVWQPIPDSVRRRFRDDVPTAPADLAAVHDEFMHHVLPFATGNVHPGFMGWVHGGGTPVGMLAEMLAAGVNANLGGRDHMPIEVERQLVQWVRTIFGFPESASGLFVTGTSIANFIGVLVARAGTLGTAVRKTGVAAAPARLVAYTSAAAHGCISQAMDMCGLGTDALRVVATDGHHRLDLRALAERVAADRGAGATPFLVVGTAGTVDIGAIDDLSALADFAKREKMWFHVDGAFGALGILAPDIAPRLAGIERADSLAFDFHKWGQVPYDAGFILVRDGELHRATFASDAAYLRRETRGLAAGSPWPCDFGPDLSRGFRALKTWFTLKTYGTAAIGNSISRTCALARDLAAEVSAHPALELLAPVELNIVCFGYRCADADRVNAEIAVALQESGIVAPSTTRVGGRLALRAAIVNHRTSAHDIRALVNASVAIGAAVAGS
jgi:glutamate/tyrosine decarboxylase-like PLP-dependent enzyme